MDLFKDIFKDVTYTINERIRNPYWFSFLLIFVYFNWQQLLLIFHSLLNESIEDSINCIGSVEILVWQPVLLAFLGVAAFYLVQYFGLIISVIFQDRIKPHILSLFSSKRIATVEKVVGLKSLITQLDLEKRGLEDQISSLKSVFESQITDYNKKQMVSENTIENLSSKNEKLQDQILQDREAHIEETRNQLARINNLEKSVDNFNRQIENTTKENKKLKSDNSLKNSELRNFAKDLSTAISKRKELEDKIKDLEKGPEDPDAVEILINLKRTFRGFNRNFYRTECQKFGLQPKSSTIRSLSTISDRLLEKHLHSNSSEFLLSYSKSISKRLDFEFDHDIYFKNYLTQLEDLYSGLKSDFKTLQN